MGTVATDAQGALLASERIGHTDPRVTMQPYIEPNETVNPVTDELLNQVFAQAD